MNRRDFLRACAAVGVSGLSLSPHRLLAQTGSELEKSKYLFVNLIAHGGWDTTCLCDPKTGDYIASNGENKGSITRLYETIGRAGNLSYPIRETKLYENFDMRFLTSEEKVQAAIDARGEQSKEKNIRWQDFFDKHHSELRVINGIHNATLNHLSGQKNAGSGLKRLQHPSLGALYAAHNVAQSGMPYISYGGYAETRQLLGLIRPFYSAQLLRAAQSNQNPVAPWLTYTNFHSTAANDAIQFAADARMRRLLEKGNMLPRKKQNLERFQQARIGSAYLERLQEMHPGQNFEFKTLFKIEEQARLVVAAYKAGLCSSANIVVNAFDTHSYHDLRQPYWLAELLHGFDFLIEEANRQGIADNLVVLVSSDFGRPPFYNRRAEAEIVQGKDHWDIGSAMLWGKDIIGNRVVGQTNARLEAVNANGDPLDLMSSNPNEKPITMEALHYALRRHLGISQDLCERFSLNGPDITGHDPDELLYG